MPSGQKGEQMSTTLTAAHRQWATRPADERFSSLEDLQIAAHAIRNQAATSLISANVLHVTPTEDGDLLLNGRSQAARLTNWAFSQLAQQAGAPAGYVSDLPAPLAAACLNHGLEQAAKDDDFRLLFNRGAETGALTLRALNSDRYSRVWNSDVVDRLVPLTHGGWKLPLAYANGEWGAEMVPSGAYLGDRDLFVFLVNEDRRIADPTDATGQGLARGFFVRNSEVGYASLSITTFLYRYVCGNHFVWGAENVATFRRRHVGAGIFENFSDGISVVRRYADSAAVEDEARIQRAARLELGDGKDKVIDIIAPVLKSKVLATSAYEVAERTEPNPRTVWGIAQGITRLSQEQPTQDKRLDLDLKAQEILRKFALN